MTSPNIDLGVLPNITAHAESASGAGVVRIKGGLYERLPEGVSNVSITGQGTGVTAYLCTSASAATRYATKAAKPGEAMVFANVSVPRNETRYLQIVASTSGDVGVTIITWPLA